MRPLSIRFGASLVSLAFAEFAPALADPPATWTPDPNFPDYYQRDPAVMNGSCACAPVAAVDSFFWLAQKYDLPNLTNGVTWQVLTNRLEGPRFMGTDFFGNTSAERFVKGMDEYIDVAGYQNRLEVKTRLGGSGDPPTLDFIRSEVAAGEDVEILVLWIENARNPGDPARTLGGHWVAVTGYTTNDLLVADPWTNNDDNAEVMPLNHIASVTLDVDNNGGTVANYTQDYLEVTVNDGLTFAGADNMIVFAAVSESPVPEPTTWALMAIGFVGLGAAGRSAAHVSLLKGAIARRETGVLPDAL